MDVLPLSQNIFNPTIQILSQKSAYIEQRLLYQLAGPTQFCHPYKGKVLHADKNQSDPRLMYRCGALSSTCSYPLLAWEAKETRKY